MSGFKHSVKVPMQYKRVAAIIKKNLETKKSLKSLIFELKERRTLSTVQTTLKHYIDNREEINRAIEDSKILEENPLLRRELCIVLVTELLRKKELNGESKPVATVRNYSDKLVAAFNSGKKVAKESTKGPPKPRYVRVNTNVMSMEEAFELLAQEQFVRNEATFETYPEYLEAVANLKEDEFLVDIHVDALLVFHNKWKSYWACHDCVKERRFLLQDKGTCLVSELLQPPPGATVLDMCAAPGMKTVHLSNIMKNQGKIIAVEQSSERYRILCEITKAAQANIVETINADALLLTNAQCPGVEYVLVDPSCSGSGMTRMSLVPEEKDPQRLKKLAGLQIKILAHAMTEFPGVKRVAYSTCSLYQEENEEVVQRCLQLCPQFKMLSAKKALRNKWIRVGNPEFKKIGKNCIYAQPKEDFTDGIFVAIFERRKDGGGDKE